MAITDNEQVTANDLNQIAIDLGNSEFAAFSSSSKFGNTALNGITQSLVGSGVLGYLNSCKCTVSGNQISVNTGIIVFEDGSKKRITTTTALDIISGGKNYVYAKNDTVTGKISLINSLTAGSGDYVPLAEYNDGTLTDTRAFAAAKCTFTTTNTAIVKDVTIPAGSTSYTVETGGRDVQLLFVYFSQNTIYEKYMLQGYNFSTASYINIPYNNVFTFGFSLQSCGATVSKGTNNAIIFHFAAATTVNILFKLYAM